MIPVKGRERKQDWVKGPGKPQCRPNKVLANPVGRPGVSVAQQSGPHGTRMVMPLSPHLTQSLAEGCPREHVILSKATLCSRSRPKLRITQGCLLTVSCGGGASLEWAPGHAPLSPWPGAALRMLPHGTAVSLSYPKSSQKFLFLKSFNIISMDIWILEKSK